VNDARHENRRRLAKRILTLMLLAGGAWLVADSGGLFEYLDPDKLAERIRSSGPLGIAVFVAAFGLGELTQVPGTLFFATAVGVWGLPVGVIVGVSGAILACTFAFATVRLAGRWVLDGRSLDAIQRFVPAIESAPLRTTVLLRLTLGASPPVNWALALSAIGWREFLIGTVIGITPNVTAYVWLLDQLAFTSEPVIPKWAVVALLLVLVGIGVQVNRRLQRRGDTIARDRDD